MTGVRTHVLRCHYLARRPRCHGEFPHFYVLVPFQPVILLYTAYVVVVFVVVDVCLFFFMLLFFPNLKRRGFRHRKCLCCLNSLGTTEVVIYKALCFDVAQG